MIMRCPAFLPVVMNGSTRPAASIWPASSWPTMSGSGTSTKLMVDVSTPSLSSAAVTVSWLMLLSVLMAMVLPARSAGSWTSLSPFTAMAAVSFSGSSVAWMPCEMIFTGRSWDCASSSDTTLEKPISWSPDITAGMMAAPPWATTGSTSRPSSSKNPLSMPRYSGATSTTGTTPTVMLVSSSGAAVVCDASSPPSSSSPPHAAARSAIAPTSAMARHAECPFICSPSGMDEPVGSELLFEPVEDLHRRQAPGYRRRGLPALAHGAHELAVLVLDAVPGHPQAGQVDRLVLAVDEVVVDRHVGAGVADVAERGAERTVVVERQRQREERAGRGPQPDGHVHGDAEIGVRRALLGPGDGGHLACLVDEQVDRVTGVVPQQVVGPRAGPAQGVLVLAPEEERGHHQVLQREVAGGDAAVDPLVAGVEAAGVGRHGRDARPPLGGDDRLG